MGLFSFIKDAGEKLFGHKEAQAATIELEKRPSDAATQEKVNQLNRQAADGIKTYIQKQNLSADDLNVTFDGATGTVSVFGKAPNQETKEKIVLCCGNVEGVGAVNDQMSVSAPEPEATFHTVVRGDTLSKIAQAVYGDAMKYPAIFEANKPMLSHPDKIYPGQVLRIPVA